MKFGKKSRVKEKHVSHVALSLLQFANKRHEVFVLRLGDYLKSFWPNLESAHTLYESLKATHRYGH